MSERTVILNEKGRLRKLALSGRNALTQSEREIHSLAIAQRLLLRPELRDAKTIMCYRSVRSEVDTEKIVENFFRMGKILCFPRCEKGGIMHAYSPCDETAWKKGMMGIPEPDIENSVLVKPKDIDLVLCPMVAFDEQRHRLGYGGGYYDRYLPECKNAIRIGLGFEVQKAEKIPADEYDLSMDIIITEEKEY